MKNNLVLILTFFVLLFLFGKFGSGLPLSVNQVTTAQPAPFTVTAEGKVVAKPDTAQINLGIQTQGSTVKLAQGEANKIINAISVAVKGLGINEKDIKTTNYNIYTEEQSDLNPPSEPTTFIAPGIPSMPPLLKKVIKYKANINLLITVRDLDKANDVIDLATAKGANQVGGINFVVNDLEKFQSEARKIAIDNAKVKATEIAKEAGITLVRIINVSEGYSNNYPQPMMGAVKTTDSAITPTQVEPGSSEITSSVTLSYETR